MLVASTSVFLVKYFLLLVWFTAKVNELDLPKRKTLKISHLWIYYPVFSDSFFQNIYVTMVFQGLWILTIYCNDIYKVGSLVVFLSEQKCWPEYHHNISLKAQEIFFSFSWLAFFWSHGFLSFSSLSAIDRKPRKIQILKTDSIWNSLISYFPYVDTEVLVTYEGKY